MASSTTKAPVDSGELVDIGRAAGLAAVGVAPATTLEPARTVLELRKRRGLAGDMQFTYRNPTRSTDPETVVAGARSMVVGALDYGRWRRPVPADGGDPPGPILGDVARYSWHDHYADLELALQAVADRLTSAGFTARVVADSNALVDRNAAWAAGIGWYGKNSNLLLPGRGSWFVLGAVVTDAELRPTGAPLADGCGPCNRCIEDCPTEAIVAPGVVDATRCLAWIVQAPGSIPAEYRAAVGTRLYGCDDCQTVCPPNRAADLDDGAAAGGPIAEADRVAVDVIWLLAATDEAITARYGRWYIPDRNVDYLRRTGLVVLGNAATPQGPPVEPTLRAYLARSSSMLVAHAVWATRRLGLDHLLPPLTDDTDPEVAVEYGRQVDARYRPEDWRG